MRNYVECCLGGDTWLPGMTITRRKSLEPGDVLLVCSDGLWSGVGDERIAALSAGAEDLPAALRRLGEQSVRACGPYSDNTSAAALRFLGSAAVAGQASTSSPGRREPASRARPKAAAG
jgi:serine/threonine protein phosphatase PrpC